jgi:hypothetical protein
MDEDNVWKHTEPIGEDEIVQPRLFHASLEIFQFLSVSPLIATWRTKLNNCG